jgi:N-acetyl-anhydromuramyl-L-alanine amidase AmpD
MSKGLHIQELLTDQFEARPAGAIVDTIIIHSMHNPEAIDPYSAQSCLEILNQCEVSAHYIIDREGAIWRCVAEDKKAWHAGVSCMPDPSDGREGVNAFSLGIELVGNEDDPFSDAQYLSLGNLTRDILSRYAIRNIYGHSDIAPDRKTDPWGFDWNRFRNELLRECNVDGIKFCGAAYCKTTTENTERTEGS